jgi:hypothetical protein
MDDEEYEYRKRLSHYYKYDVFLICPVREASDEQKKRIKAYIAKLKGEGKKVYYPADDTVQTGDDTGLRICQDNCRAIRKSREVHIFYDPKSEGSRFDLGIAFAFDKTLRIVNPDDFELTEGKSFANMITVWSKLW